MKLLLMDVLNIVNNLILNCDTKVVSNIRQNGNTVILFKASSIDSDLFLHLYNK